jgi:hypothetical protein
MTYVQVMVKTKYHWLHIFISPVFDLYLHGAFSSCFLKYLWYKALLVLCTCCTLPYMMYNVLELPQHLKKFTSAVKSNNKVSTIFVLRFKNCKHILISTAW